MARGWGWGVEGGGVGKAGWWWRVKVWRGGIVVAIRWVGRRRRGKRRMEGGCMVDWFGGGVGD